MTCEGRGLSPVYDHCKHCLCEFGSEPRHVNAPCRNGCETPVVAYWPLTAPARVVQP